MKVYLISPAPTFGNKTVTVDSAVGLSPPYAMMAAAGISTVAALFPEEVELRLCDEITEPVDDDEDADVVAISVNVSQAARGLEIARRFRRKGRTVIMGGAHVSLAPQEFEGEADCLVIGEFEPIAAQFMTDLLAGELKPRYQGSKADLATSPMPRWDLYNNDRALAGVVQTSRGCPFECNFCDVIQYLGRSQRHKPPSAVIAEARRLYDLGYRQINLSDDNFTVYRKRTRTLLQALADWNGRDGREPVAFSTQMSIDIARDTDLLDMCNEAGLRYAFLGIETSNPEALKESRKRQNLHRDLVEQCTRVVAAGVTVQAGLMVGFDSDDLGCFEQQFRFGMSLPVVNLRLSVLVAPVATPLYEELKAAGRLADDPSLHLGAVGEAWTNILPAQMTRAQLAEGADWLMGEFLAPANVIRRFEACAATLKERPPHLRRDGRRHGPIRPTPFIEIMSHGARDRNTRPVIDAVNDLCSARPAIRDDLMNMLGLYLNAYLYRQRSKQGAGSSARHVVTA